MKHHKLSHVRVITLGYLIMILLGTALLMLPCATRSGNSADPVTALFTATSASCVTGLVLHDTATYWSLFGQLVILVLIQIGGLGFMTIAIFFFRLISKKSSLRERAVMAESINTTHMGDFSSLVRKIIIGTIALESTGGILLALHFVRQPDFGFLKGVYYGFFHAISAFCNAGFDLMGGCDSFTLLSDSALVNAVLITLIVIGGIGFLVWDDITACHFRFKKFSLHTKTVLTVTAVLILGGALLLFVFEHNNTGKGKPVSEEIWVALFGSVTARTAGFNTVDTAALSSASKLITIILMFIGGSSGSTAGGVKTTTVAVVLIFLIAGMRGQDNIHFYKRRIRDDALRKSVIIISTNLMLLLFGATVLCAVQGFSITDAVFETTSAISTVGMTTGVTRDLNLVSKLVIIFLMYCGRVGSISFGISLFERRKPPVSYPEESVTVG
ncbi:MAG: potassium transporter TrkG [Acutalibacteraceae bacterium]|nr:potassium transporter TrkG [Acutalibacteraceae bacterium]